MIFNKFRKKSAAIVESTTIAGYKFRVLDPMSMPKIRQAAIFLSEYEKEWGMTKEDLLAYDDVLINQTDFPKEWKTKDELIAKLTDKLKGIYELLNTRRILIQEDFQYKPHLKIICNVILLDDEIPEKIDRNIYQKKLELCNTNEDVLAFFLQVSAAFQQSTLMLSDISEMSMSLVKDHILSTEKLTLQKIDSNPFEIGSI